MENGIWHGSERQVVCKECKASNLPFNNMQIKNAWQLKGFNHYQYECTRCGVDNEFKIKVQREDGHETAN